MHTTLLKWQYGQTLILRSLTGMGQSDLNCEVTILAGLVSYILS